MINTIKKLIGLLLSFCLSIVLLMFAVKSTIIFKPLYYMDIRILNLEASSGRSSNEIKETYSYIIDYLTDIKHETFKMPNFKFTTNGEVHFTEVKRMVSNINMLFYSIILLVFLILSFYYKYIDYSFLKTTSLILLSSISSLLIELTINFNKSFTNFHKLFFKNDYWLFDPYKDPVINILPERFFFHCAVFILIILITFCAFLLLLYRKKTVRF